MENNDRRKFARVDVYSSISYVCVDDTGNLIDQQMGVALNISQTGLLLETGQQLETNFISLMFVDLENNLAEVEGEIVYCHPKASGMFQNGIHFRGSHAENIEFAQKLIRAYHYRKSELVLILGATA